MASWAEFEAEAAELASAGRRLLVGEDGVAIAFLASCGACATGRTADIPHLSPVCPVFAGDDLYLCSAGATPKTRDLRATGRFVLHAFLGEHDEEFQVSGRASEIPNAAERARVHAAIAFASFGREDPIFRLGIDRALWVYWERVGRPDTKAIRRRWSAPNDSTDSSAGRVGP